MSEGLPACLPAVRGRPADRVSKHFTRIFRGIMAGRYIRRYSSAAVHPCPSTRNAFYLCVYSHRITGPRPCCGGVFFGHPRVSLSEEAYPQHVVQQELVLLLTKPKRGGESKEQDWQQQQQQQRQKTISRGVVCATRAAVYLGTNETTPPRQFSSKHEGEEIKSKLKSNRQFQRFRLDL